MHPVALDHVQLAMPEGGEDRAREFYAGILGLAEVPKPASLAANGGAWFKSGDVELHLGVERDFAPARKAHPALLFHDINRLATLLRAYGSTVEWDDRYPGVRRFYVHDPFGNRLEIMEAASYTSDAPPLPRGSTASSQEDELRASELDSIYLVSEQNSSLLENVAPDVFDHAVRPDLLREFLANPMNHLAVAVLDDTVVGMVSAITYVHPDKPLHMFVNELGVASTHRRLGIGRRLMEFMLEHGRRLGCTEAWVGTEVDNEAALSLYPKTDEPAEERAVIFTYDLEEKG